MILKRKIEVKVDEVNFGWESGSFEKDFNQEVHDRLLEFEDKSFDIDEDTLGNWSNSDVEIFEDFLDTEIKKTLDGLVHEDWSGWQSITFYFDYTISIKMKAKK
jgi:hypothetical protein